MNPPTMPDFAVKMVEDLEEKIAELESDIREKKATRAHVIKQYGSGGNVPVYPTGTGECPLLAEEMYTIGDRHQILRAIAERVPGGRVHTRTIAEWLHHAGFLDTAPVILSKTLSRRMRQQADIWIDETGGWFRLRDFPGLPESLPRDAPGPCEEE